MLLIRRPTFLLSEAINPSIKRLYCFDMDDTLLRVPNREDGEEDYEAATGKKWPFERWWSVPQSLHKPLKVEVNPQIMGAFKRARTDTDGGKTIVMTGRLATKDMKSTVGSLLTRMGFGPLKFGDSLFMKKISVRGTLHWKKSMLTGFLKRFPNLEEIHMWDDRGGHVKAFSAHISALGLQPFVHHVAGGRREVPVSV